MARSERVGGAPHRAGLGEQPVEGGWHNVAQRRTVGMVIPASGWTTPPSAISGDFWSAPAGKPLTVRASASNPCLGRGVG